MLAFTTKPSQSLGSFSVRHALPIIAITLAGLWLRVLRLEFQPLWWDEGYSVFFATRDFATMLERTAIDIHPPLYYALLQVWMFFLGQGAIAARWFSVFIGVATIPLMYALARQLFPNTRVPLLATLLLALSPLHIYYSQEVRMYGLVTFLGLASVYLFIRLLDNLSLRGATLYILVTTAALYTQYYAAFVLAFEILVTLTIVFRSRSAALAHWPIGSLAHLLRAWLAIALLYLPWVIYAGPRLYDYVTRKVSHEAYAPLDPITFLAQHLAAFSVGHLTAWTWLAWGSAALVALVVFGVVGRGRAGEGETGRILHSHTPTLPYSNLPHTPILPYSTLLVSLYLIVPLALAYAVNLLYPFHPIRTERLLLLAAPAFYLLAARGIESLWNRRAILGAVPLLLTAMLAGASLYDFYKMPRYPDDDYRPLIADMQKLSQPGDNFLAIYPWQIGYLESYYQGAPLTVVEAPSDRWINNPAQMRREVDTLLEQQPRVWLPALQTLGRILEDSLDTYLRPRDYLVLDTWFGTTRLELFTRASDPPRAGQSIGPLDGWGVAPEPVAAGRDVLRVLLDWNVAPVNTNLSLRLLDAAGNLWAQDDRGIEKGRQRIGLAIPAGTPPGEYALRLRIYRFGLEQGSDEYALALVNVIAPAQPNIAAIARRVSADMGNGIELVGYELSDKPDRPGAPVAITLFWRAARLTTADWTATLRVQDASGKVVFESPLSPVYPRSRWKAGELVRDPQTFTLPGNLADGEYRIVIGHDSIRREIATIQVKGRPRYFGAPAPSHALSARVGDFARLVGYDVNVQPRRVTLILYWQALAPTQASYKVFAHIVDAGGEIRAQSDKVPGDGSNPTTTWAAGEYLSDLYEIPLPSDLQNVQIRIGMYDPATGARLPVFDATGQLVGDQVVLK
ncbi:MAG: glycosyltransferase family 39 protein [Chloroflexi bacterium]|nr:glycosyltransferase family 39 protein [Chloroflexota bacterium]